MTGEQEPVTSSFVIRYHSVLNLWHPENITLLERLSASSFREYQRLVKSELQEQKRRQQREQRHQKGKHAKKEMVRRTPPPLPHVVIREQMSHMAASELYGTIQILHTLEYIDANESLTLKGELLRRIVHPTGIVLVELLTHGGLDALPPVELAEVCSWLVIESDRRLHNRHLLSSRLQRIQRILLQISSDVSALEEQVGVISVPKFTPDFHGVALCWARGKSLGALLQQIDMAEGDLLMALNQTIDLLQQVHSAVGHVLDAHETKWTTATDPLEYDTGSTHPSRKRKRTLRQHDIWMSLSTVRPRLIQARKVLIHGLVQQSRTIPVITSLEEDFLPFENAEDIDPPEIEAEMEKRLLPEAEATLISDSN